MSDDTDNTATTVDAGQTAATQPAASPSADTSAQSPSAQTSGEPRKSLLDAVQQAVPELRSSRTDETTDETPGASPAPTARSDQQPSVEVDDPTLSDDATPEELAKYSQSAKRRIGKLVKQRNDLRGEVERQKTMEPSAKAADSVSQYLRDNDIGRDDFLLTLELAAAMRRGDFRTFYEGVQPYMKLAEKYLGVSLPADLQQRVREGHMTTQAATAFARERMDRAMAQNRHMRAQQFSQAQAQQFHQQQQVQQREVLANQVRDAVNGWEQTVMGADPDYAAKRAAVQDTMWAVVREKGAPQSPDHAIEIAREAYRRVNERYRSWTPPKRPTSRSPSSTGRTTGAAPEAKSLLDVVRQARESARL